MRANTLGNNLRIIWAIVVKDIGEAVKNKTILTNVIMLPVLIVLYKWLPTLYNPSGTRAVVYDAGQSQLVIELENSPQFRLVQSQSFRAMEEDLDDMPIAALGLSIPADFDEAAASGQPLELDGYVMHWVSPAREAELRALFERQLAEWTDHPVRITTGVLYPRPSSMGPIRTVAITTVVALMLAGLLIVPNLMLEEKQARTMDALMISPAGSGQVVAGKALAGLFYCLALTGLILLINQAVVVQRGLAILTALVNMLFAVALGLALGVFFDRRQQLNMWGMTIMMLLLIPVFLNILEPVLPELLRDVLNWTPAMALAKAFRFSFSLGATPAEIAANLGLALGCSLLVFAAIAWKIRRAYR
jgi:ABC-2 type transport system permease protein